MEPSLAGHSRLAGYKGFDGRMSTRPWWSIALQWGLWFVAMSALMGWLGRSRLRARSDAESRWLKHPTSTLIMGAICLALFGGMAIVSNIFPNKTATWWTTAIFLGFAAMSAPLVVDYFSARHEVSESGLSYRSMAWKRTFLPWADVTGVRYAAGMKWFRIEMRSGFVARFSVMLMGLPELASHLLDHAPPAAIDAETRLILEATARGNPPSVWV